MKLPSSPPTFDSHLDPNEFVRWYAKFLRETASRLQGRNASCLGNKTKTPLIEGLCVVVQLPNSPVKLELLENDVTTDPHSDEEDDDGGMLLVKFGWGLSKHLRVTSLAENSFCECIRKSISIEDSDVLSEEGMLDLAFALEGWRGDTADESATAVENVELSKSATDQKVELISTADALRKLGLKQNQRQTLKNRAKTHGIKTVKHGSYNITDVEKLLQLYPRENA